MGKMCTIYSLRPCHECRPEMWSDIWTTDRIYVLSACCAAELMRLKASDFSIGIIYKGYEGYRYPTFQDEKVKNFQSHVVNRGDLRRLNYNKTVHSRGSAQDPAPSAHDTLPDPRVRWGKDHHHLPPHSAPLWGPNQGCLVLFLNWYPHFLDQSYAPGFQSDPNICRQSQNLKIRPLDLITPLLGAFGHLWDGTCQDIAYPYIKVDI